MPKVRLYFQKEISNSEFIYPSKQQVHYIKNVLRKKDGDQIFIFNDREEWLARLELKRKTKLIPINLVKFKEDVPDIWICFSLIKSKNINYLIEKITEIGVKKIIPILTDHSERLRLNYERLNRIIVESVEQSESLYVPKLEPLAKIDDLLKNWNSDRSIIFCDESGGEPIFKLPINKKRIAIFVGPVGGWSEKDKSYFRDRKVFKVTLGKNILKADTAAIFSLSCVRTMLM
tara:strand:+ start:433 stop:1128 length:696 start_codon:yes stop_codon:yes gene_type:complete